MRRICVVLALVGLVAFGVSMGASGAVASIRSKHAVSPKEPTIHLKQIGTSYTRVYTDGVRWAVYEPTEGVTRIMDTVRGTSTTRPDPEGCAGGLIAVGGGEILYACSDSQCAEAADVCLPEQQCPPPRQIFYCSERSKYESGRWTVEDLTSGAQYPLNIGKGLPPYVTRYGDGISHWTRSEANGSPPLGEGDRRTSWTGTLAGLSEKKKSLRQRTAIMRI